MQTVLVTRKPEALVVRFTLPRMTRDDARWLRGQLQEILATDRRVVLDLASVQYVDSAALGVLLEALLEARRNGGDMKAARLSAPVTTLFEFMRLYGTFDVFGSVEGALGAFRRFAAVPNRRRAS